MTITQVELPIQKTASTPASSSHYSNASPANPRVSVIIVEYKAAAQLESFLRHMAEEELVNLEYIVYRNSCNSDSPAIAAPSCLQVREMRDSRNLGFGAAFNKAVAVSDADVIVSCNSDILPGATVLRSMIGRAANNRELVAPVLFNAAGEERGRPFYSPLSMVKARIPRMRVSAITGRSDWVIGACFAITRSYFNEIGGFHRAFKLYVEDVDLCWRVRSSGGTIHVLEHSRVFHEHGRASRKILSKPFIYHLRGGVAFFVLHPQAILGGRPNGTRAR